MKNCELFTTVQALQEAWARRVELTKGCEGSKFLPESILHWACFWEADTALDPKLKPGTLVETTGIDLVGYPEGSFGIVVRPFLPCLTDPITRLRVRMVDGKDADVEVKYLRPSKLPKGVMQLARNQVMEEIKAACPLCKKED